ncbi:MAG: virulence RhuM family protein [Methanobrevibacter sp.]|nr:virulence RhuM family protein [Methanobrevibacter sp.]
MVKYELVKTLLYQSEEGAVEGEFIIGDDTLWASRKVVAEIFGTDKSNISRHFSNIVFEGELEEKEVSISSNELFKDDSEFSAESAQNSKKGGRPQIWYDLDAIISIGYRINSKEATKFRIWSRGILKKYMREGYVLNKDLLMNGGKFNDEYFDNLLEEIREIRSSERRVYEKVTDLFATAYDYNKNAEITRNFYAKVQNKLHYAVSGLTAPELIHERADSTKEHMGLTSWRKSPDGKVYLSDAKVAKNYLTEKELKSLNRIVSMYLDYAEDRAERHIPMSMKDWIKLPRLVEAVDF